MVDRYRDQVAGMALVPANEAKKYRPFTGTEPELQDSNPVWVVGFSGEIPDLTRRGGASAGPRIVAWIDPTCVVRVTPVTGDPEPIVDRLWFLTGGARLEDGTIQTPPPVPTPPLALPPLQP
jgi:hypothetical protein